MAAITSHWWHRLVNAQVVKATMVCLQCKNRVIHTMNHTAYLALFTTGRYTNLCSFTYDCNYYCAYV